MKTELFTLFDNNFNVHLPSLVHPDNFAGTVKGKAIAVHGNVVYIAAIRNVGEPSQHVVVVSVNIGTYLTNQISLEGIAYKEVAGLYVPTSAVTGLPEADPTIILTDYTVGISLFFFSFLRLLPLLVSLLISLLGFMCMCTCIYIYIYIYTIHVCA